MTKRTIILLLILIRNLYSQVDTSEKITVEKDFPQIALTNYVEFNDSKYNNPLAGCAFLLEEGNEVYAVTCKHALWAAKTDKMKYIHFEGTLKEWRMRRKDDTTKYIITEKLLNEDRTEKIGEDNVHADYLVFKIKENRSDVKPVKIRKSKIKEGEDVYIVGWSFRDKTGPQRVYKTRFYKEITNHILLINKWDYKQMAGLSGGPVLDKDGYLVGIVSNYTFDEKSKKWYDSPCKVEYLKKIIKAE